MRPQSTTALIEGAEERRFRKTDETSRTLEEFAFGFEGEVRKTIDFFFLRWKKKTAFVVSMKIERSIKE